MGNRLWQTAPLLLLAACSDTPRGGSGPESSYVPDGGAGSGDASAVLTCTSNSACIDRAGGPALCVSGQCVAVDTTLCSPEVLPSVDALRSDNVVVLGGFFPLHDDNTGFFRPSSLGVALALKEIAESGGIPGSPPRNVAMILCDSSSADLSVAHVTRELRLPAILGNLRNYAADNRLHISRLAARENVFTVNMDASPELKFSTETKGLAWNLTGTEEDAALAYRPLVQRVETYVKSRPDRPAGPLKVAVLENGGPIPSVLHKGATAPLPDNKLTYDASKALFFNGKSAMENGDNLKGVIPYGYHVDTVAAAVGFLDGFRPDVVIALLNDVTDDIAEAYESKLGTSPPVWLLGPNGASSFAYFLAKPSRGGFAAKKSRALGVAQAGPADAAQRTAWLARMAAAYPNVAPSTYAGAEVSYDAAYWLTYALAADPAAPVSGPSFAAGVRKLLAGPKIHPGPDAIAAAFSQLAQGSATFEGALGPPDFDVQYGTWNTVGGVYCFEESAGGITTRPEVLRYNRSTGGLDGTFDCFAGF